MSTAVAEQLYTADQLFEMGEESRCELVKGILREMSPTGGTHGSFTAIISGRIIVYVADHGLGTCFAAETGFIVNRDPDTVFAPDFAFVAKDRVPVPLTEKFVPVVPDLVVETRSPWDRKTEVLVKVREWLDADVRMVLELNPMTRQLTVYRPGRPAEVLGPTDDFQGDDVLPGFALEVSKIFV